MYDVVRISSGQTVSAAIDLGQNCSLAGLQFPAAMTGATLTFQAAPDGTNYKYVQNKGGGGRYSVTVAANEIVPVDITLFKPFRRIKVVSASAEVADRDIGVVKDSLA